MCKQTIATLSIVLMMGGIAQAADRAQYPDWKGSWVRWVPVNATRDSGNGSTLLTAGGQPSFDQTKPWGLAQQPPLTPEYQKVLEDSIADQVTGGQGNFLTMRCAACPEACQWR
jgi:hypothetical protein